MSDPTTSEDCLKAAFAALTRGDTTERDRLCERAKNLLKAEDYACRVERALSVDFYVNKRGIAIPVMAMAKAAGAIQ